MYGFCIGGLNFTSKEWFERTLCKLANFVANFVAALVLVAQNLDVFQVVYNLGKFYSFCDIMSVFGYYS